MGLLVTVSHSGAGWSLPELHFGQGPDQLRDPAGRSQGLADPVFVLEPVGATNKAITSAGGGAWYSKPARSGPVASS